MRRSWNLQGSYGGKLRACARIIAWRNGESCRVAAIIYDCKRLPDAVPGLIGSIARARQMMGVQGAHRYKVDGALGARVTAGPALCGSCGCQPLSASITKNPAT